MIEAQNRNFLTYILLLLLHSSISARKSKCPSTARLGNFTARARSSRKIPARTHLYCVVLLVHRLPTNNGEYRIWENIWWASQMIDEILKITNSTQPWKTLVDAFCSQVCSCSYLWLSRQFYKVLSAKYETSKRPSGKY